MPRYEFSEGTSNKFWEIEMEGTEVTTRWGKIGTDGQSKTKDFGTDEKAEKEYQKLIAEKTKKGYELVDGDGAPKKAPAPKKEAAPKKAAPKKAAKAVSGDFAVTEEWQRFEFVEGSSNKFWEIKVEGSRYLTRYGKIGTEGKITVKDADDEDGAIQEANKLLAQKVKKGYEPVEA